MKKPSEILAFGLIGSLASLSQTNAATIVTEAVTTPATTDPSASFFSDSAVGFTTGASRYRTNATLPEVGSSFIHDDGSSDLWNLTTITVLAHNDNINSATENVDGLTLRIYSGDSVASGDQLGSDITFGSGTFDAGGGSFAYLTFNLTTLETAAIGDLTQGSEYTFTIQGDADTDIRISRNVTDTYLGTPFF